MTKNRKKLQLKKKIKFFFWSKTAIYLSPGLHKYVQVTEEAFSAQKKPSNTSKHELLQIFLWVTLALLDPDPDSESGSGSTGPIEYGSNPDPEPCLEVVQLCNRGFLYFILFCLLMEEAGSVLIITDPEIAKTYE